MKVAVIIPALNEAGNIERLVDEVPRNVAEAVRVIVVDNGSTDSTAAEAHSAGAEVVSEPRRGYGYACAAGVAAAIDWADVLVFLDGDGSFDPGELSLLLKPLEDKQADLVLGTRVGDKVEAGAMPPHQLFGNRLVSFLMRLIYSIRVTDLGPFRAIRSDVMQKLNMQEMTYGWPTEMMIKTVRQHAILIEIPVTYRKRWSGQSKVGGSLRGTIRATYRILRTTFRYAFAK